MRVVVRGGRVVDPLQRLDAPRDLVLSGGKVESLAPPGRGRGDEVVEAKGRWVVPGLIDPHVHLREPGEEHKETVATGLAAAIRGGITRVCSMANTRPPNDSAPVTEFILRRAAEAGAAQVSPIGALSKGLEGEVLAEYGELKEAGCVAVSDDGRPVMSAELMRRALEYARAFGLVVVAHCEDLSMSRGGAMNEGLTSTLLGLQGVPAQAEEVMVARDLALAELTGGTLHLAHLSTAGSVRLLRDAKRRGLHVTAEATPHHLTLTEEAVREYDTNARVNPPLRTGADVEAVRGALADGTIDCVASDHAPHDADSKRVEFHRATNGISGLETSLALSLDLVHRKVLTLGRWVAATSANAARIFGLPGGTLKPGAPADVTIVDPEAEWTVDAERFVSKGRNSPFHGRKLRGRVSAVVVGGRVIWRAAEPPRSSPSMRRGS